MYLHTLRVSLGSPFSARILEVADQLFLLGVHRDNGKALLLLLANPIIEVNELSVPIRVCRSLPCLPIRLQRVIVFVQEIGNDPGAHRMPHRLQLGGQFASALRCPSQRIVVRRPRSRWLDQIIQVLPQRRVRVGLPLTTAAWTPDASRVQRFVRPQLLNATKDPLSGHSCRQSHNRDPTVTQRFGFRGGPQTTRAFRQHRSQGFILRSESFDVHTPSVRSLP